MAPAITARPIHPKAPDWALVTCPIFPASQMITARDRGDHHQHNARDQHPASRTAATPLADLPRHLFAVPKPTVIALTSMKSSLPPSRGSGQPSQDVSPQA